MTHRGPRVSVGGGLLHVAQRDADVERGCDQRTPEHAGADALVASSSATCYRGMLVPAAAQIIPVWSITAA